ncbi:unnamed protein product [Blepharisma stoltei]|uniref:Receptor ligand binding region domain-containing protein n=1 Tax=Blepharisma stoltei TaxID=1481888 RepID=A0AAU9JBK7_9CILI|nr:unnamed protein product [Blepharisma stoltei]
MSNAIMIQNHTWKLLFLIAIWHLSTSLEVIVAYEDLNSDVLNEDSIFCLTGTFNNLVDWHKCKISNISMCYEEFQGSLIILDLSRDLDVQYSISQLCKAHFLTHLVFQDNLHYIDDWTYSVITSKLDQIEAFLAVLNHFKWKQGAVFIDKKNWYERERMSQFSSDFNFLTVEEYSDVEQLVNRLIFKLGATLYYIITDSEDSLQIQNFLKAAKLLTIGNGIILNQRSGYLCDSDGLLIITDSGQEASSSSEEYYLNSAISTISYILSNISKENALDIISALQLKFKNHYNEGNFSIINIQNGERVIVGSIINKSLTINKNLSFPGESSAIPKSTKKVINLSINAGSSNPDSSPASPGLILGSKGVYIVKDKINEGSSSLLSNFQLDFFNYDCGATVFNSTFAMNCLKKDMDKLGVAYMSSGMSNIAIGILGLFKQLNWTFPVVGSTNSDVSLNSTDKYPMYTRVSISTSYSASLTAVLLRAMGWEKAAILTQNNSYGQQIAYYINQGATLADLEIINPKSSWFIPPNLDRESVKNYTYMIQEIIDSQARLLILSLQFPMYNYIYEMFYDLGMRKGDIMIFAAAPDSLTSVGYNDTFRSKRLEIAVPMIELDPSSWVGNVGKDIKSRFISTYNEAPNSFACQYADGAYLIAYALDYMINRGQDYTNPYKLDSAIRNQQFQGCTGRVSIEKGSNDRIVDALDIAVNKLSSNDTVIIDYIGKYMPYSTQVLKYTTPMIYPDGSTIKPSDLRNENNKCPFSDKLVRTFTKGRGLLFGICFTIAFITFAITVFIWRKWWNISVEPLAKKEEISIQDFIVGLTIAVEIFQYAAMGPDFSLISPAVSNVSDAFSLNLEDFMKLKNGVFWIVADLVFAGIGLWIVLCLVVLLRLDEKWHFIPIFRYLSILADYAMPILGNLCFIPFVSICLDIFICDQSIGENFTDSFLSKDCYYFCWKDEHLAYAIISFIALLLYEPSAVFCRPLWQELQPILHVKAVPLFLMIKTIVQVTLIVMNKTVKRAQDITHGVLFIIVMVIYILFIFKFKPYNYGRFSWWQGVSLAGVAWLALISVIGLILRDDYTPLLIILIIGWLIIAIIGFYIQRKKYPSLLFKQKDKDTSTLFRFAFTFGKSSRAHLTKIAPSDSKKASH